jgi:hypothetical protein
MVSITDFPQASAFGRRPKLRKLLLRQCDLCLNAKICPGYFNSNQAVFTHLAEAGLRLRIICQVPLGDFHVRPLIETIRYLLQKEFAFDFVVRAHESLQPTVLRVTIARRPRRTPSRWCT